MKIIPSLFLWHYFSVMITSKNSRLDINFLIYIRLKCWLLLLYLFAYKMEKIEEFLERFLARGSQWGWVILKYVGCGDEVANQRPPSDVRSIWTWRVRPDGNFYRRSSRRGRRSESQKSHLISELRNLSAFKITFFIRK